MICLVFLASLVLPAVLGTCCYPDKFTATEYVTGDPTPRKFAVDFKLNRYISRPIAHAVVEFAMHDQQAEKSYIKFKDGSCIVKDSPKSFQQCINPFEHSWGVSTLAGGSVVETFGYTTNSASLFDVVTKDGCLPVFRVVHGLTRQVIIFTDVSTNVIDYDGTMFRPDVSMCKSAPGTVG